MELLLFSLMMLFFSVITNEAETETILLLQQQHLIPQCPLCQTKGSSARLHAQHMSRNMLQTVFTQATDGEHLYFLTVHLPPLFVHELTVLNTLADTIAL